MEINYIYSYHTLLLSPGKYYMDLSVSDTGTESSHCTWQQLLNEHTVGPIVAVEMGYCML